MDGTIKKVAESFGLEPINIYRCKYYYVAICKGSSYCISQPRPSKERLESIHIYKELIKSKGFLNIDSYILCEGKPYSYIDGNLYICSRFVGNNELDIKANNQCRTALETIGHMHSALYSLEEEAVAAASLENKVLSHYEKQLISLFKIKKWLSGSSQKFDIALLKFMDNIIEKAEKSVENLRLLNYGNKTTLCHGSLKEGNIIYNKGKCYIIDWDNMKRAHFAEDITFFIKRYVRKNAAYSSNYMTINEAMTLYKRGSNVDKYNEDVIYQLLLYPHRIIELLEEYTAKKRGFVPSGIFNKVNEVMEQWDFYYDYIGD